HRRGQRVCAALPRPVRTAQAPPLHAIVRARASSQRRPTPAPQETLQSTRSACPSSMEVPGSPPGLAAYSSMARPITDIALDRVIRGQAVSHRHCWPRMRHEMSRAAGLANPSLRPRMPPHEPVGDTEHRPLVHDLETASSIQPHVLGLVGFKMAYALVTIELVADRHHQPAADPLPLALAVDRGRAQVP